MAGRSEYCPFQPELDSKYPVGLMRFGSKDIETITAGKVRPMTWCSLFRNSPANNMEAEILVGRMITEAVRAGQWIDIPVPIADEVLEPASFDLPNGTLTIGPITYEFRRAADILCQTGLARRMSDEQGRNYLRPTEGLMQFVNQRVGFR